VKAGNRIVLGAGLITNLARQHGMIGIELYGQESVNVALDNAFHIMEARLEEISNSKRQQYILENFNNGVIIVSDSGSILNINHKAIQFLGLGDYKNIAGTHVRDLFKESELTEVLLSTKEVKDKIVSYQSTKLFINAFPIVADHHYSGLVVIFSDVDDLQQKENKIRRTIYNNPMRANYKFEDIIGQSAALKKVIEKAKRFARSDSNILILGESGTGKELFAQSIHNESRRAYQPFIAVNCAAVPENLLESEFFGYVEGAFTGARKGGKPGLFEQAHNGTVFLDEIGEIPLSMQSKLLRVLQENVVMRIGSSTTIPVNVRIISATNVDLIEKVKKGTFRMDLYYRIAVLNVFLPPLRQRIEDIEALVLNYTKRNYPEYMEPILRSIKEMVNVLSTQKWYGNIRELENTLERMFAYLKSPQEGTETEILESLHEAVEENHLSLIHEMQEQETSYRDAIKVAEMNKIKEALREANGNKIVAAKLLGMSRSTLWRKLNEMNAREL
jgi:propionate catabolism operon transcriptional regulator